MFFHGIYNTTNYLSYKVYFNRDIKEICDNKKPNENNENNNEFIPSKSEENNQNKNHEENDSQIKLNINSIIDESMGEANLDKINNKPNLNFLNISETNESINDNKNEFLEFKNKKIDSKNEPEPLDTTTENGNKGEDKINF